MQTLSKKSGIPLRPTGYVWPMRRLARDHLWHDLHIGWDIWNTIGDCHFTAICYSVSRVTLLSSATMPGATDFQTGTSAICRWMLGSVTLKQLSMQQDLQGFPFLHCRKAVLLPLRLRRGTRNASRIFS